MIWGIVEVVVFVLGVLLLAALVITNLTLRIENKKLKVNLTQESIDRSILMEKLQEVLTKQDSDSASKTDGFLKFVSDSREAAFKYIEEVQAAINEFDNRVGPVVKYYKETGKVLERKPSELVRELTQAYDKLMSSMPKEDNV